MVLIALMLFTAIACISVNNGVRYYNISKTEADTVRVGTQRAYAKLKQAFDTTDFSKSEEAIIEGVWMVDWTLWEYAIKQENPLSAISIGQNDIFPKIKRTRFATEIFSGEQDEFKNPEQLLTGNLDLSYFILFLFPLLFIAISYNTASADKESGVHKLFATQGFGIKSITTARVVFKWLISMFPFFVAGTVSYFILHNDKDFAASSFLEWMLVASLYAVFWLSLVISTISRGFNSMINALTLVGLWLLLLVGIPGMLNSWFQYKYPSNAQQQITRLRDVKSKLYDLPLQQHKAFLKSHFPGIVVDTAKVDTNQIKWYSGAIMELQKEKQVYNAIAENVNAQTTQEEQMFWVNPIGGVMRAFTSTSGSSLQQQQDFEKHLMHFKQIRADYLIANHSSKKHFGKSEFEGLPLYKPAPAPKQSVWKYLLPIGLLIVLLGLGMLFTNKNNFRDLT